MSEPEAAQVAPADKPTEDNFVYEEVTLDEEHDDGIKYEEVPVDDVGHDAEDDFEAVIKKVRGQTPEAAPIAKPSAQIAGNPDSQQPVVDDFIRNFLLKKGMKKTLDSFQTEWYQLQQEGKLDASNAETVPNLYVQNEQLTSQLQQIQTALGRANDISEQARSTWDKFRKERDTHKMHHRRVVQEKNLLLTDMKRMRKHYSQYEPMLRQLKKKYEDLSKEKTLLVIERDRLQNKLDALENGSHQSSQQHLNATSPLRKSTVVSPSNVEKKTATERKISSKSQDTPFPPEDRVNPNFGARFEVTPLENFRLSKTFKGHTQAVSAVALHPRKPIVATVSDDRSWKLWSIPSGDLIMSGDGHRDWLASVDFHPDGTFLATASGDGTAKLWDFKNACCAATLSDHTQAVWDVAFHDMGDFLATASMDHTAKLWDLNTGRCRQSFRDHVDSVNSIAWLPFSNTLCTASGDKTVSLWDIRSGLCTQTFYGHHNAVNHLSFSAQGDTIVSSDADGVLKLWDVRMIGERAQIVTGIRVGVNEAYIDRSGERVLAATDSGAIKVYSIEGKPVIDLEGHEDSVQALALDPLGKFIISAGSDRTFRLWSA